MGAAVARDAVFHARFAARAETLATLPSLETLELTESNVETVLDEARSSCPCPLLSLSHACPTTTGAAVLDGRRRQRGAVRD